MYRKKCYRINAFNDKESINLFIVGKYCRYWSPAPPCRSIVADLAECHNWVLPLLPSCLDGPVPLLLLQQQHVGDVAASWFLPSSQTKTSGSGPNIQRRLTKNLSFSLSDNITLWLMTQFLPPNLLALFAPREPIPYLPPSSKLPTEKKNVHVSW